MEYKNDYINYRINKSKEIFEDAVLLYKHNRWNSCINRLYYSSYYLISALLYKHSIKAETHNGLKTQFYKYFIATNKLNQDFGKLFSHLFDWRQESDYADFIDFNKETIEPVIERVKELNKAIEELIVSNR